MRADCEKRVQRASTTGCGFGRRSGKRPEEATGGSLARRLAGQQGRWRHRQPRRRPVSQFLRVGLHLVFLCMPAFMGALGWAMGERPPRSAPSRPELPEPPAALVPLPPAHPSWHPRMYGEDHDSETIRRRIPAGEAANFVDDPFVWGYTAAFARRYGMPEKWVAPGLRGAEAVAFRIITGNAVRCGLFGNPKACEIRQECQLDFYLPKTANLFGVDTRAQMFQRGYAFRSLRYLRKQVKEEWFSSTAGIGKMGIGFHHADEIAEALGPWPQPGQYGNNSLVDIREFDRTYLTELDYLSTDTYCHNAKQNKGVPVVYIREFPELPDSRTSRRATPPQMHQIIIPRRYWDRVNAFHAEHYNTDTIVNRFMDALFKKPASGRR